jgi:hypothetical protein
MEITEKTYPALNAQAANYRTILRFLIASGINEFLTARNRLSLDIMASPEDTTGGESAIIFLKALADECNRMDMRIKDLSEALVNSQISLSKLKQKSLLQRIKERMW